MPRYKRHIFDVTVLLVIWCASGFPHLHPVPQRPTGPPPGPRGPPCPPVTGTSQMCLADLGSTRSPRQRLEGMREKNHKIGYV